MPRAGVCSCESRDWPKSASRGRAVLIQQHVGRLEIAVQHALAVGVQQADGHVAKQAHGFARRQLLFAAEQVLQRALLDVLHHVVRRLGIPADFEQLHHVAVGRKECQLLDLAREHRPIEPALVGVELDRHLAARVAVARYPHFAIGPCAQKTHRFVAGHFRWRPRRLEAQRLARRCSSLDCCWVWLNSMGNKCRAKWPWAARRAP